MDGQLGADDTGARRAGVRSARPSTPQLQACLALRMRTRRSTAGDVCEAESPIGRIANPSHARGSVMVGTGSPTRLGKNLQYFT